MFYASIIKQMLHTFSTNRRTYFYREVNYFRNILLGIYKAHLVTMPQIFACTLILCTHHFWGKIKHRYAWKLKECNELWLMNFIWSCFWNFLIWNYIQAHNMLSMLKQIKGTSMRIDIMNLSEWKWGQGISSTICFWMSLNDVLRHSSTDIHVTYQNYACINKS